MDCDQLRLALGRNGLVDLEGLTEVDSKHCDLTVWVVMSVQLSGQVFEHCCCLELELCVVKLHFLSWQGGLLEKSQYASCRFELGNTLAD